MINKGKISDIFFSVQGEGLYAGAAQIFVRLYGCNISCRFCDTKLTHYDKHSPRQAYSIIKSFNVPYHSISFTGGEPLLQEGFLGALLGLIKHDGTKTYLETNGILYKQLSMLLEFVDIISMDIKLPTSTGLGSFWREHERFLELARKKEVFIKAVVSRFTSEEDMLKAFELVKLFDDRIPFVLQPNFYDTDNKLVSKLRDFQKKGLSVLRDVRIMPQLHKMIGVK